MFDESIINEVFHFTFLLPDAIDAKQRGSERFPPKLLNQRWATLSPNSRTDRSPVVCTSNFLTEHPPELPFEDRDAPSAKRCGAPVEKISLEVSNRTIRYQGMTFVVKNILKIGIVKARRKPKISAAVILLCALVSYILAVFPDTGELLCDRLTSKSLCFEQNFWRMAVFIFAGIGVFGVADRFRLTIYGFMIETNAGSQRLFWSRDIKLLKALEEKVYSVINDQSTEAHYVFQIDATNIISEPASNRADNRVISRGRGDQLVLVSVESSHSSILTISLCALAGLTFFSLRGNITLRQIASGLIGVTAAGTLVFLGFRQASLILRYGYVTTAVALLVETAVAILPV